MSKRRSKAGDCAKCGVWRWTRHRDHIVPKYKGGSDDESNIQHLCANCHEDKTREDMKGFLKSGGRLEKLMAFHRGRKQSKEWLDKRSVALRRVWANYTPEERADRLAKIIGKKRDADTRERMSAAMRGVKPFAVCSAAAKKAWETRRANGNNSSWTPESKKKQSESLKRHWAAKRAAQVV